MGRSSSIAKYSVANEYNSFLFLIENNGVMKSFVNMDCASFANMIEALPTIMKRVSELE